MNSKCSAVVKRAIRSNNLFYSTRLNAFTQIRPLTDLLRADIVCGTRIEQAIVKHRAYHAKQTWPSTMNSHALHEECAVSITFTCRYHAALFHPLHCHEGRQIYHLSLMASCHPAPGDLIVAWTSRLCCRCYLSLYS